MQTYPELLNLLLTAISAARSRSASFNTMKGSLPPNSIICFFKYLLAIDAILLPAVVLPVNEIPETFGFLQINSN